MLVVIVTCIIFLNFIIAEASASYQSVKDNLDAMINKEKASLIAEAEGMYFESKKNNKKFPKYIVIRKAEIWANMDYNNIHKDKSLTIL